MFERAIAACAPAKEDSDPLKVLCSYKLGGPRVYCAALGALLTFPSNASVERVYSATGNAVTALRNRLSLENVGATVSSSRGGNYRATRLARRRRGSGGKSYFLGVFLQTTYILTYDESFLPRELRT